MLFIGIAYKIDVAEGHHEFIWFPTGGDLYSRTGSKSVPHRPFRRHRESMHDVDRVMVNTTNRVDLDLPSTLFGGLADDYERARLSDPLFLEASVDELEQSFAQDRLVRPILMRYYRARDAAELDRKLNPRPMSCVLDDEHLYQRALDSGCHTVHAQLAQVLEDAVRAVQTHPGDLVNAMFEGARVPPDERPDDPTRFHTPLLDEPDVEVGQIVVRPNGQEYVARSLSTHPDRDDLLISDVCAYRAAREHDMPILLQGLPGTGKTAAFEATFPHLYTVVGTADTDVSDFVGSFVQLGDGSYEWCDGPLLRAMQEGAVLLVDEIGLVDPKVQSVLYSAMDGRQEVLVTANPQRGAVRAAPGFFVVAASNPRAPGARLSEALLSRFLIQLEVGTDHTLLKRLGVRSQVIRVARNLEAQRVSGEISWAPQMRECLAFERTARALGEHVALGSLVASAPEFDRAIVAATVSRVFGHRVEPLRLIG